MNVEENPYPHIVIDDFLSEDLFVRLVESVAALELERKESDLFSLEQSDDLTTSKDNAIKEFKDVIEGLKGNLKQAFNVDVSHADLMAAFYFDTDYLLPHDDQLDTRKVAFILYLSEPEDGGALALYKNEDPFPIIKTIKPQANRLVLFEVSEHSWHEVQEVIGETPRASIGGWLH